MKRCMLLLLAVCWTALCAPDQKMDSGDQLAEKRGPYQGFTAMRGKKAMAFTGVRGKKDDDVADYMGNELEDYMEDMEDSWMEDKRSPKGFFGMRGKKAPLGFFGVRGKKGPGMAFYGVRGKKAAAFYGVRGKKDGEQDSNEDNLDALLYYLTNENLRDKRGPLGFTAVRGKKNQGELIDVQ